LGRPARLVVPRLIADVNPIARPRRIAADPPLPIPVTDDRSRLGARLVVIVSECSSQQSRQSESGKVIARNELARGGLRLPVYVQSRPRVHQSEGLRKRLMFRAEML